LNLFINSDLDSKLSITRIATVGIDLSNGTGSANYPEDFKVDNSIIIGWIAKNIYGAHFSNYASDVTVYTNSSNIIANSLGNFSGKNAYIWVTLLRTS
jgi:hypothetical protein